MSLAVRRAAPAAALLVCLLFAGPAEAAPERPPVLTAQIAQATPTATPAEEPPLTDDPPELDGTPTPTPTPTAEPTATPGRELPETGSDAGLVALAGLSLLGMGLSLRIGVHDGRPPA